MKTERKREAVIMKRETKKTRKREPETKNKHDRETNLASKPNERHSQPSSLYRDL